MRRWTVLLIPHDSDQPRSFAVSLRAMRATAVTAVLVAVAAVVGVGAVAGWMVQPSDQEHAGQLHSSAGPPPGRESAVDSLRATVEALYGALDSIRHADARLREAAGLPPLDSASTESQAAIALTRAAADSLLRGAKLVAGRLVRLADSARGRDRSKENRTPPRSDSGVRR